MSAEPVPPPVPAKPFSLLDSRGRKIEVYPPVVATARSPLVVFLHATCMQPSSVCDWFDSAARDPGWLVCPSGNETCAGQPDWHGSGAEKAAFLESALATVAPHIGPFVDDRPGVLIGWSRGAFAARDILGHAQLLSRRFRGLVLIAAAVSPDAAQLRAVGIARVVMASGDLDGARPVMRTATEKLRVGGIETRFVSLGNIGHVWPTDFDARMREPIAWAAARPEEAQP